MQVRYYQQIESLLPQPPCCYCLESPTSSHTCSSSSTQVRDPFEALTSETITNVLLILPKTDLASLRVSRIALDVSRTNTFWKRRIMVDMPWLFDLPEEPESACSTETDWRQVYLDFRSWSTLNNGANIPGLVSRRRI